MRNKRKFNSRKAPVGQVRVRVDNTCKFLLRKVNGDPRKINQKMIQIAAEKQGLSVNEITEHLNKLKAKL